MSGIFTRTRLICLGLIILLLAVSYPHQGVIERTRAHYDLAPENPLEGVPAGEFFGTVLIGGFRAIAVDIIWMQAQQAERNNDYHRLLMLYQLIANLQPRFTEVWIFNTWNLSYNLSIMAPTDRESWEWVKRGLEFGKEGFRRNPDSTEISWEIGRIYFHKCGSLQDDRALKYQQWLLEETGQTNWEHAAHWFKKAFEVAWRDYYRARDERNAAERDLAAALEAHEAVEERYDAAREARDNQRTPETRRTYRAARRERAAAKAALEAAQRAFDRADNRYETVQTAYHTGGRGGNPNRLDMVATSYRQMAYEAEERGELDKMYEYRRRSIDWLSMMIEKYPLNNAFQRYAPNEIADLQGRIEAHQRQQRARQYRETGNYQAEFGELFKAGMFWMNVFRGNPYIDEQHRHLVAISNRMEELMETGPERTRKAAERLRTEIRLQLLSAPELHAEYIEMAEALDTEYSAKLEHAIADQHGREEITMHLRDLLRLRLEKQRKEQWNAERKNATRRIVDTIEELEARPFTLEYRDDLDDLARQAWYELLRIGYDENVNSGIERLKKWVDKAIVEIGDLSEPEIEETRLQIIHVLTVFNRHDYHVDWTVNHLRHLGRHYVKTLERTAKAGDIRTAIGQARRSETIWRRIRQRLPGDQEAELLLNRTDEIITIYILREPLQ